MNKRTSVLLLVLLLGIGCFFIIKPFFIAIMTAIIFSIVFYPIYRWVKSKVKYASLASFLVCLLIFLLVIIPSGLVIHALVLEADSAFRYIRSSDAPVKILEFTQERLNSIPFMENLQLNVASSMTIGAKFIVDFLRAFATSLPTKMLMLFVIAMLVYYLLKDGKKAILFVFEVLPLSKKQKQKLISQCSDVTYAVVYGQIVTAIIQGTIATIGYYIFGVPAPILWGVLTTFFALIPYLGTAIAWLPLSIYLFLSGMNSGIWWQGLGLFLYGLLIVGLIDNIIRPKLIGDKSGMHPAIVLIGVLGGIPLFGFIGLFVGPLILALFLTSLTFIENIRTNT